MAQVPPPPQAEGKNTFWPEKPLCLLTYFSKTIKLNSGYFSDWFMEQCFQELQDYVKEKKGVLK